MRKTYFCGTWKLNKAKLQPNMKMVLYGKKAQKKYGWIIEILGTYLLLVISLNSQNEQESFKCCML